MVDPDGELDVANYGPGDLWFFPKGHAHAISTLGDTPCHALLTFDDGFFSERGTFGISDWVSRVDAATLALNFGVPTASCRRFSAGRDLYQPGRGDRHSTVRRRARCTNCRRRGAIASG